MEGPIAHFSTQHLHDSTLYHAQPSPHHPTLVPQLDIDPTADPFQQYHPQLENHHHQLHHLQQRNAFEQLPQPQLPRFHEVGHDVRNQLPSTLQQNQQPQQNHESNSAFTRGGQFGVLTPHSQLSTQNSNHPEALGRLQNEVDLRPAPAQEAGTTDGHFSNLKMIADPPNLEQWRKRLFDLDETITMTEDEFQTYFPHVDNIYSHRSTQKYKRKPFISHYWDCRLKGRPPGTPKSEDPNKKKRKRNARERDLCDVKIKITEYFPGPRPIEELGGAGTEPPALPNFFAPGQPRALIQNQQQQSQNFGVISPSSGGIPADPAGSGGSRYYTVQRVNGNGGNGKDGTAGPHKHTLQESDRVKKNSIARHFLKIEKVKKKTQKPYHKKATGTALATTKKHSKEHELKLYGSCFCPFVQRVWISMEVKGIHYQYIEVDPYKKPESLMKLNPRGLVPTLQHGDWACYESTVLMEYLEDLNDGTPLLPSDAKDRAHARLWADHINRHIIPSFYRYLQAQDESKQVDFATELRNEITKLVGAAHPQGPFFLGPTISFVDIQIAPWILRMKRVLAPYRGWPDPEEGTRWSKWIDAIEKDEAVKATTSGDELYLDSYERYAENRPDTSELAKAVNSGRGLP